MLITQLFLHACLNWLDYLSFQNFKIDFNIKILSLKCSDAKKKKQLYLNWEKHDFWQAV